MPFWPSMRTPTIDAPATKVRLAKRRMETIGVPPRRSTRRSQRAKPARIARPSRMAKGAIERPPSGSVQPATANGLMAWSHP